MSDSFEGSVVLKLSDVGMLTEVHEIQSMKMNESLN